MPYCIYTNKDVAAENGNFDHIIPLALGGADHFTIWSEKNYNSGMGSRIDGQIANDPFIMLARSHTDARGHNNKPPVPVWKKTTFGGNPVQLILDKENPKLWDARQKRILDDAEWAGKELESTIKIDFLAPWKFAAKVALAGGYFVYGDLFRENFDCDELRTILDVDLSDREALKRCAIKARLMDRWHPDSAAKGRAGHYRYMCEVTGRTTVIFVPHGDGLSVHIGVVGAYLASIIIEGNGSSLPCEGNHDLGHVILIHPGEMQTMSFRELAEISFKALNKAQNNGQGTP